MRDDPDSQVNAFRDLLACFERQRQIDLGHVPELRFLCHWGVQKNVRERIGLHNLSRWIEHHENQSDSGVTASRWSLPLGEAERQLVERSSRFNDVTLSHLFAEPPAHAGLDAYNMSDWVLQHAYPRPTSERLERVLDFGAGFGRQAALWLTAGGPTVYVATDSIGTSYAMQQQYLAACPYRLVEYMANPAEFRIEDHPAPVAYHLPAWRYDLLPPGFFDMIVCVQVLPELREDVLSCWLGLFYRLLRPGGYLYVRDHALLDSWQPGIWSPGHRQLLPRLLPHYGFALEFAPRWKDRWDVHGLPQVWRRTVPQHRTIGQRVRQGAATARRIFRWQRYRRASLP